MAKFYSLLLVFVLAGCIQTREGIRETEQKRAVQDQVSQMQRTNAETSSRYQELNQDLREMNGRIEVLENKMNQLSLHMKDQKGGDQAMNLAQEKKIQALQEEITKFEAQIVILSQNVEALRAAPAAVDTPKASGGNTFDVAEDLFEKKEFKKAIHAYQKFRDQNPKSKKNAKAIYKIGLSFQELGLKEDAKPFFEDLIAKYPQSEEAKLAKAKLAGGEEKKPKKKKKEG